MPDRFLFINDRNSPLLGAVDFRPHPLGDCGAVDMDLLAGLHQLQAHLPRRLVLNGTGRIGVGRKRNVGADGDAAGLKYLLSLLPGELNVADHIPPERDADVHQLWAAVNRLRRPLPERLQILPDLPDKLFPVRLGGDPGIPLRLAVAGPNMRYNAVN